MTVVSVSMPEELVEQIDGYVDEHGFSGRSEVLREAARALLDEFEERDLSDSQLMAIVTVLFNFETSDIEQAMTNLRHEHENLVSSNLHSHVGDGICMELFILEGDIDEISTFVGKVRGTEETLSVDYSVIPIDEVTESVSHP